MKTTLKEAKKAGLKVIRTWAFNEKNETYVPGGMPMYGGEGAGPTDIYFQSWKKGVQTLREGPTGLGALDNVVRVAEETGIKLIMTLTNNWAAYGGMDVYTVNLGGQYHDDFYRDPKIIDAFQKYVGHLVNRYKDSPAVFAWELANEPRCGGDGATNLPRSSSCDWKVCTMYLSLIVLSMIFLCEIFKLILFR